MSTNLLPQNHKSSTISPLEFHIVRSKTDLSCAFLQTTSGICLMMHLNVAFVNPLWKSTHW